MAERNIVVKVTADLTDLRELLNAVDTIKILRENHTDNGYGYCQGCAHNAVSGYPPFPCPTIRTLNARSAMS